MGKRDFGTIKSLLHFDFPYPNEQPYKVVSSSTAQAIAFDGDDVGIETWVSYGGGENGAGSVVNTENTTPKFGWHCLTSKGGILVSSNVSGIFNLNSSGSYEIECFVKYTPHTEYEVDDWIFSMGLDTSYVSPTWYLGVAHSDSRLIFTAKEWGITEPIVGSTALTDKSWHHIVLRISQSKIMGFLDGSLEFEAELIKNIVLTGYYFGILGNTLLGKYEGYTEVDEFVFRHSAGSGAPTVPTHPYSGRLDIAKIGGYSGYGTVDSGSVTISSNTQINSYGIISSITDAKTFTVSSWSNGSYTASTGCEVLIHITAPHSTESADYPLVGLYAFAKVAELDGNNVTLSRNITTANGYDFDLDSSLLDTYYVQAIVVPCFSDLTVNATISSLPWNVGTGGGIVAFRVIGDLMFGSDAKVLTSQYGPYRYDYCCMSNSKFIERFLYSRGGCVFITCGGTCTISSTARLGASWSGEGTDSSTLGSGAGYGGLGGSTISAKVSTATTPVGGGGGGCAQIGISTSSQYVRGSTVAGGKGSSAYIGGGGAGCGGTGGQGTSTSLGVGGSNGGVQGLYVPATRRGGTGKLASGNLANGLQGGNAAYGTYNSNYYFGGAGGGAPGGEGGMGYYSDGNTNGQLNGGVVGSCIVLLCNTLAIESIAPLSTGGGIGQGVSSSTYRVGASGGGGTGFCYIACERQVE